MHKYIKHILFFLSLFILHFSFGNNLASLSSIEGINVWGIEFSEKTNLNFSEPDFRENYIFEPSFLDVVSCRSVSYFGGYAKLLDSWKILKEANLGDDIPATARLYRVVHITSSDPHS